MTKADSKLIETEEEANERKRQAVQRLSGVIRLMAKPPEPLLDTMSRLGVPYLIRDVDGTDCYVMTVESLEAGEARHQALGSIYKQVYGEEFPTVQHKPGDNQPPSNLPATLPPKQTQGWSNRHDALDSAEKRKGLAGPAVGSIFQANGEK